MAAFTNNLNFGVNLVPTSDSDGTLGASNKKWNLYVNYINGSAIGPATVGLGNVENTKLSTWAGSSNLTTVGTISSGTWQGTAISSSYIGSHNHAAGNITSGTLAIARGGTNASTTQGAKANLGLGTSAMDFGADTFQGATQHWGIYAVVQESTLENTNKAFAGKNTAIITKDNGLYMYNLTDNQSIWQFTINASNIVADVYTTPKESNPGTSKASYKIAYKANDSTAVGGSSTPVYVTANGEITAGTAIGAAGYKGVTNITSITNLGWTDATTSAATVPTMNTLAYWNGAYNNSNYSNLQYLASVVNTKNADTSDIVVNGKSSHLYLQERHIVKGINPSTQYWSAIEFHSADTTQPRLGLIEHTVDTSGNSQLNLFVVPNVSGSTNWSGIILKKDTSNNLTISLQGPTTVTSGTLTVGDGIVTSAITASDGAGLLAYKPTGWSGISNTQWGVGTANCPGIIRSSDNNLIHYRAGTNYAILDTYNCLDYTRSSAFVGRNAEITANKNWYKVASCSISDANQDREIVFHVYDTMVTGAARSGILNVRVRTSNPLTSTTPTLNLVWEYNNGFTSDQFKLVSSVNTSPCVAELWTNIPYNWIGRVFTVIRMGTRTAGQSNDWTLYKNYSTDDNGATASTSSLTNSVTATYLPIYLGNISGTYIANGGTTYGLVYKNSSGNMTAISNCYFENDGWVLLNKKAAGGSTIGYYAEGSIHRIGFSIGSSNTYRGIWDANGVGGWTYQLDADSNLYINAGKASNEYSTITLNPNNNSSKGYGVNINGYCAVALNIYAGGLSDTVERQCGARALAGRIFLYSDGAANSIVGLYYYDNAKNGHRIIDSDQNGWSRFYGKSDYVRDVTNAAAIDFDYAKSGGYSATPWVCMWVNSNNNGAGGTRIGAVGSGALRNKLLTQGSQSDQMWSWGGITTNSANTSYVNKELYLVTTTHGLFLWNQTDSTTTWNIPNVIYNSTQPTVVNGAVWLKPV